jgi:hypothetical protein
VVELRCEQHKVKPTMGDAKLDPKMTRTDSEIVLKLMIGYVIDAQQSPTQIRNTKVIIYPSFQLKISMAKAMAWATGFGFQLP